jgi:hypothetical protein
MGYFQYDVLREVSRFVTTHQWSGNDSTLIRSETGQPFSAPETHSAWRNYKRIFKLCLLFSEKDGIAIPTPVAQIMAQSGVVTCDEYLHFLVEATTDPSPALTGWKVVAEGHPVRHPLCFALKYLLAKVAGLNEPITPMYEVIGAYISSGFTGAEDDTAFLGLMANRDRYEQIGRGADPRQARESIKFISQISYLHSDGSNIITSLSREDAMNIFQDIQPISGPHENDGDKEIQRLAALFKDGSEHDFFDYSNTIVTDVLESGFAEGSKVKKTHIVIERNSKLRQLFFERKPTTICDACNMDTHKKYPWVKHVLDLHHILPLSSGTRVDSRTGTMLDDLVPVCPTCHRAIHRFYDGHLKAETRKDFLNEREARDIYIQAKGEIIKGDCYA